jgi:hypothetical protein
MIRSSHMLMLLSFPGIQYKLSCIVGIVVIRRLKTWSPFQPWLVSLNNASLDHRNTFLEWFSSTKLVCQR